MSFILRCISSAANFLTVFSRVIVFKLLSGYYLFNLKKLVMNAAQIHLALNHVPLFLSIIGGGILILGLIKKNETFKNLSLYLLIGAALFTVPVFLTGEGTEELVEHLPGVSETVIEKHEDMAKLSLIIISITGVVALAGLFLKRNARLAKFAFTGALLLSLVSFGAMAQTAHLGGLIRHTELKTDSVTTSEGNTDEENENEVKDNLRKVEKVQKKDDDD